MLGYRVSSVANFFLSAGSVDCDEGDHEIKIEVLDQSTGEEDCEESITDIQNYLQRFNKEIQAVQGENAPNNGSTCGFVP